MEVHLTAVSVSWVSDTSPCLWLSKQTFIMIIESRSTSSEQVRSIESSATRNWLGKLAWIISSVLCVCGGQARMVLMR